MLGFFEAMWSGYFPGEYRDVASFLVLTFLAHRAAGRAVRARLPPDQSRLTEVGLGLHRDRICAIMAAADPLPPFDAPYAPDDGKLIRRFIAETRLDAAAEARIDARATAL